MRDKTGEQRLKCRHFRLVHSGFAILFFGSEDQGLAGYEQGFAGLLEKFGALEKSGKRIFNASFSMQTARGSGLMRFLWIGQRCHV